MAQEEELSKNGNPPGIGGVMRAEFRDFDHFAEALVSWDISLMPLEPGGFRGRLFQVMLPGGMLMTCSMSRGVNQRGALPPGCRTIGIPMKGCTPFRWMGHEVADDVVMIFPPADELDSRSNADFQVTTLSVREDLLQLLAEREGLSWLLKESGRVVRPSPDKLEELRMMAMDLIRRAGEDAGEVFRRSFREEVEVELAQLALQVLAGDKLRDFKPMAAERSRVLRQALEMIEDRVQKCPSWWSKWVVVRGRCVMPSRRSMMYLRRISSKLGDSWSCDGS